MQKLRLFSWLGIVAIAIFLQHGPIQTALAAALALLPGGQANPLVVGPVAALFQGQPTPINGYPGPAETPLPTTGAYPGLQPSPPADTDTLYPVATATPESGSPPLPIVGQEVDPGAPEPASVLPANASQAARGRLFLWGGFVVALLLFATGVAAAIVLFTRRRG